MLLVLGELLLYLDGLNAVFEDSMVLQYLHSCLRSKVCVSMFSKALTTATMSVVSLVLQPNFWLYALDLHASHTGILEWFFSSVDVHSSIHS